MEKLKIINQHFTKVVKTQHFTKVVKTDYKVLCEIMLNKPEALNSLDIEMMHLLIQMVREVRK